MARPEFELRRTILTKGIKLAYKKTKKQIPSRTLRSSLYWEVTQLPMAFLEVPHYWAAYYHDGVAGPITPRRSRYLVWFANKLNDPRLVRGKGPVRFREVKRLTPSQWEKGMQKNYVRRRRGLPPYMIVVKIKRGFRGTPFYNRALGRAGFGSGGLAEDVNRIAVKEFGRYMKNIFKDLKPLKMDSIKVINDKMRL